MTAIAPWEARRYQSALEEIRDISSGSTTVNSLPHIARIAEQALATPKPRDTRHHFAPHRKWPWFCRQCGYPPHEPLQHIQEPKS